MLSQIYKETLIDHGSEIESNGQQSRWAVLTAVEK